MTPAERNAYLRAYYLKRRKAGVCWRCGGGSGGKSLCPEHAERNRKINEARRAKNADAIRARSRERYRRLKQRRDELKAFRLNQLIEAQQ